MHYPRNTLSGSRHRSQHFWLLRIHIQIYTNIWDVSPKSVLTNLSSKFDRFLAVHSQFDTGHRVNFYVYTCCQSATFGPLFAFYCPLFYTEKKKINNVAICHRCDLYARCRQHRLLKTMHNFAQLRTTLHNYAQLRTTTHNYAQLRTTTHNYAQLCTTTHNGRFYSFINKISFHGSRHFIFTGSL